MKTHWMKIEKLQVGDLVSHYAYGIGLVVSVFPISLTADIYWFASGSSGGHFSDSLKKIEAPSE